MVLTGKMAVKEELVQPELMELRVMPDLPEQTGKMEPRVLPVLPVLLDLTVRMDRMDLRVHPDLRVLMVHPVRSVAPEPPVKTVVMVLMG